MRDAIITEGAASLLPEQLNKGLVVITDRRTTNIGKEPIRLFKTIGYNFSGLYMAPEFNELQVNGGAGFNFDHVKPEEIGKIIEVQLSYGTTRPLPALVIAPNPRIRYCLVQIKETNYWAILAGTSKQFIEGLTAGVKK